MADPPHKNRNYYTREDGGVVNSSQRHSGTRFKPQNRRASAEKISAQKSRVILADGVSSQGRSALADGAPSKRNKKKRRPNLLLIFGIILIVAALAIAGFLAWRYISANLQYQKYADLAGVDVNSMPADVDPNTIDINWDALHEVNPDIVGWLIIPDTRINYPIVQATDNSFYLNHLFDKSYGVNGAIFLDYESDTKLLGKNNMVYGHNMLDGSMFAGLKDYRNAEFYDTHKRVLILTPEHSMELEVVSILTCEAEDKIRQVYFGSDADYQAYMDMLLQYAARSEVDSNKLPSNIYCFATCTELGNTKRFLVMAELVQMDGQVVSDAAET